MRLSVIVISISSGVVSAQGGSKQLVDDLLDNYGRTCNRPVKDYNKSVIVKIAVSLSHIIEVVSSISYLLTCILNKLFLLPIL